MEVQLTGKVGVVDLGVAQTGLVQDVELGLVSLGEVGKVLVVAAVDVGGVGLALLVAEVIPAPCQLANLANTLLQWEAYQLGAASVNLMFPCCSLGTWLFMYSNCSM